MIEHKAIGLQDAELKFVDGELRKFEGYASVFGGKDLGGDTIMRGAYAHTLSKYGQPKLFFNHRLGDIPLGKLKASEDEKGLLVKGELTPGVADHHAAALKHETVDGLSIGYMLKQGDWEALADGGRLIKRVSRLLEVSIVNFPMDDAARIDEVKSAIAEIETIRDFERFLRDEGGFSKAMTEQLVTLAKTLFRGEPEEKREAELRDLSTRLSKIASTFQQSA